MTKLFRLIDAEIADGAYQNPTMSRVRRRGCANVGSSCWAAWNCATASVSGAEGKSR